MALPDSLTPYEVLRGVESTLAFTTAQLNELAESQPDTRCLPVRRADRGELHSHPSV